jgi:hypothetical protein
VRVKTGSVARADRMGRAPAISPAQLRRTARRWRATTTVVDEADRRIYNVRFGDIRLARLDFDWPARGR